MVEVCAQCGKEFPFRFLKPLCQECEDAYGRAREILNPSDRMAQYDFEQRHLRLAVAHFYDLTLTDQRKVLQKVNVALRRPNDD